MPRSSLMQRLTAVAVLALVPLQTMADEPVEATLDNGLKVVVKRDARAPVAVSQLWYRVGSIDEVNGRTGLSHLLEHMMFKGTPTVPAGEFSRRIAAAGGQDNAFTSRAYTVYYQLLAAASLPLALQLEADRMRHLDFKDDAFKSELEVVREERRWRVDDQPSAVLYESLYASAFVVSPSRTPVIGWMDDIRHMQPGDLRQWYRQWYVPNNTTLVVVGDVDPQTVIAEAKQRFGGYVAQVLPERRPQLEPTQLGIRRITVKVPSELPYLLMGWKVPRLQKIDDRPPYSLYILSALLAGQDAARLPRNLVRKARIVTSIRTDYELFGRDDGLFTIMAMPATGHGVAEVEQGIRRELTRIARDGVGEAELERVRHQIEASRIYQRDSMQQQAMQIGRLESQGFSWRDENAMSERLLRVGSDDVSAAAQSLIDDNLTVVALQPLQAKGKPPAQAELLQGGNHVR
ncbi:pitrilysin family protein [Crenobacter sp. SG2303]|uniref:Pitrilysin family protein n=1 Tax=Crenobacter oryzisoli TaxID=3056844 RepID=A0ABT7XPI1_9NEIS|nr:pitrilysin family protein [Crenobacter sp. SG2303]MDN0075702.1 pitrilysin family protein [Crenobacter sp. SG2303]